MKKFLILLLIGFSLSCTSDKSTKRFFKTENEEGIAYLELNTTNENFFGKYQVIYPNKTKDSGEVRGVIIGDTLNGRFKYISQNGKNELKPFLLLKDKNTLKLGKGIVYTYLRIPYYQPKTIEFKDSSFQFKEIKND